jgi:hypothetical protein
MVYKTRLFKVFPINDTVCEDVYKGLSTEFCRLRKSVDKGQRPCVRIFARKFSKIIRCRNESRLYWPSGANSWSPFIIRIYRNSKNNAKEVPFPELRWSVLRLLITMLCGFWRSINEQPYLFTENEDEVSTIEDALMVFIIIDFLGARSY